MDGALDRAGVGCWGRDHKVCDHDPESSRPLRHLSRSFGVVGSQWRRQCTCTGDIGEYIYFREKSGPAGELVRVRTSDRVLEHVLSLNDFPQVVETFAGWIGLTPDDAPVLIRDRSVQEIYALDLSFH